MNREQILDRLYDNYWRRQEYERRLRAAPTEPERAALRDLILLAEMSFDEMRGLLTYHDKTVRK